MKEVFVSILFTVKIQKAKAFSNRKQSQCTFVMEYDAVAERLFTLLYKCAYKESLVRYRNDFDMVVIF